MAELLCQLPDTKEPCHTNHLCHLVDTKYPCHGFPLCHLLVTNHICQASFARHLVPTSCHKTIPLPYDPCQVADTSFCINIQETNRAMTKSPAQTPRARKAGTKHSMQHSFFKDDRAKTHENKRLEQNVRSKTLFPSALSTTNPAKSTPPNTYKTKARCKRKLTKFTKQRKP